MWKRNILVEEHPCLSVLEWALDHTHALKITLLWHETNQNLGQQIFKNTNYVVLSCHELNSIAPIVSFKL